ncbi:MAG: RHS repeat protein, partial [Planctomycetaceae bacterium]|nr:RHS repeat protein [Planctomycetaceae bacterium]
MLIDWLKGYRSPSMRRAEGLPRSRRLPSRISSAFESLEDRILLSHDPLDPNNVQPNTYTGQSLFYVSRGQTDFRATINTTDPDGDPITYSLLDAYGGNPTTKATGVFGVSQGGVLTLTGDLLDAPISYYHIAIDAADDHGHHTTIPISILIDEGPYLAEASPYDGRYDHDLDFNPCKPCGGGPTTLRNSNNGNPHPILHIDIPIASGSGITSYDVDVTVGGYSVYSATKSLTSTSGNRTERLSVLFDASAYSLATGYHNYQVTLQARNGSTAVGTADVLTGRMSIVNRKDSEFGNRWWLPVLDRIDVDEATTTGGGVGIVRGDGTSSFFYLAGSDYLAEAGTFEGLTLVGSSYVVETRGGLQKYFNSTTGLLEKILDRSGRQQTLSYDVNDLDGDGRTDQLIGFNDGFGGITTFNYTSGLLSSITDSEGVTWNYVHNTDKTLQRAYGPTKTSNGMSFVAEATFTYDTTNGTLLLTSHTYPASGTTTIDYNYSDLRVRSVTHANGLTETRTPSQIAGLGGFVVSAADPGGSSTDTWSKITSEITVAGALSTGTIDARGLVVREVLPDPSDPTGIATVTRDYLRDGHGRIIKITEPNPAGGTALVTLFEYNSRGLITKVTNADADATYREYTYATNGLDLLSERDERGKIWLYEVDSATGNRTKMTDPTGRITRYEYYTSGSSVGLLYKLIEQKGATPSSTDDLVTTFEYDARGNVTKVTYADGTFRSAVYNQTTDTLTSETDERGYTTSYTYDVYNHLATQTLPDPDGTGPLSAAVWLYNYCTCGHLMSVTGPDPDGNGPLAAPVWSYSYNGTTGQLEKVTSPDPDGGGPLARLETTYVYDSNGRLWKEIAPGNRITVYEYGLDGQVTKITLP